MRSAGIGSGEFPLSAAQLRWWVAQQLYPDVPNTVAMYLDLTGPLDLGVLRTAIARAAWELQSPHVRFVAGPGGPRQILDPDAFGAVAVHDLVDHRDPVGEARAAMEQDHCAPVDLIAGPITVAQVFRVGAGRHLLYLRSHHMVVDGVGAAAILRRTAELYGDGKSSAAQPVLYRQWPLTIPELLADERAYQNSVRAGADR